MNKYKKGLKWDNIIKKIMRDVRMKLYKSLNKVQ